MGGRGATNPPPPAIFYRSVNPISTGGGQIIPTYYYWTPPLLPQIFSPSGITVLKSFIAFFSWQINFWAPTTTSTNHKIIDQQSCFLIGWNSNRWSDCQTFWQTLIGNDRTEARCFRLKCLKGPTRLLYVSRWKVLNSEPISELWRMKAFQSKLRITKEMVYNALHKGDL